MGTAYKILNIIQIYLTGIIITGHGVSKKRTIRYKLDHFILFEGGYLFGRYSKW